MGSLIVPYLRGGRPSSSPSADGGALCNSVSEEDADMNFDAGVEEHMCCL